LMQRLGLLYLKKYHLKNILLYLILSVDFCSLSYMHVAYCFSKIIF
jgi:hypothetical protein